MSKPAADKVPEALRKRLALLNKLDVDFYRSIRSHLTLRVSCNGHNELARAWSKYDKPSPDELTDGVARISEALSLDEGFVKRGELANISVDVHIFVELTDLIVSINIFNKNGEEAFGTTSKLLGVDFAGLVPRFINLGFRIKMEFSPGSYVVGISLYRECANNSYVLWDKRPAACAFEVEGGLNKESFGYAALDPTLVLTSKVEATKDVIIRRAHGRLTLKSPVGTMSVAEECTLPVTIQNDSTEDWVGSAHIPIYASYHWFTSEGDKFVFDGFRSPIPVIGIPAGTRLDAEVAVLAPAWSGRYELVLSLVQEHVQWFERIGFVPDRVWVDVEDARA